LLVVVPAPPPEAANSGAGLVVHRRLTIRLGRVDDHAELARTPARQHRTGAIGLWVSAQPQPPVQGPVQAPALPHALAPEQVRPLARASEQVLVQGRRLLPDLRRSQPHRGHAADRGGLARRPGPR